MEFDSTINIGDYLPKYLSAESFKTIKKELESFPTDGTKSTIYTSLLKEAKMLFQGDGIAKLPYFDAQSRRVLDDKPGIIISNTCDMSIENERLESINICFAPLLRLEKYKKRLLTKHGSEKVEEHIKLIKKQTITHILYLPMGGSLEYEAIILLDKICNVDNSFINRNTLIHNRLFSLSDFGNYLFLLKMSIHFTRIRERVDRNAGMIL